VARNTYKQTFVAEKFRIGYESATKAKEAGITLPDVLEHVSCVQKEQHVGG
jgi:hypothetical protein